jgi:hypothetical protein
MSEETKTTGSVNEETVREALRGVLDPELHLDVATLGLIRAVDVDKTPLCPNAVNHALLPYGHGWSAGQRDCRKGQWAQARVEVVPEQWSPK